MAVYSFRAECRADLDGLNHVMRSDGIRCVITGAQHEQFPDCTAEIETDAPLEAVRAAMRKVEDGHVMVQTLRACRLADNSLERNFKL